MSLFCLRFFSGFPCTEDRLIVAYQPLQSSPPTSPISSLATTIHPPVLLHASHTSPACTPFLKVLSSCPRGVLHKLPLLLRTSFSRLFICMTCSFSSWRCQLMSPPQRSLPWLLIERILHLLFFTRLTCPPLFFYIYIYIDINISTWMPHSHACNSFKDAQTPSTKLWSTKWIWNLYQLWQLISWFDGLSIPLEIELLERNVPITLTFILDVTSLC